MNAASSKLDNPKDISVLAGILCPLPCAIIHKNKFPINIKATTMVITTIIILINMKSN